MAASYGRLAKPADPARKMDSLCSYLPTSILTHLASASSTPSSLAPPFRQTYTTAVLFADVSGYTAMCEQMSLRGNRIARFGGGGGEAAGGATPSGGSGGSGDKKASGKGKGELSHSSSFSLLPHHSSHSHSHDQPNLTAPSMFSPPSSHSHSHPPHIIHASTESLLPPATPSHLTRSPSLPSIAAYPASVSFGPGGDELLAKYLNSYFEQLVRTISSHGGDVFKFAGDAILVLWPKGGGSEGEGAEGLEEKVRRAAQCGMEIKTRLQDQAMGDGVTLSMKVGVGVGDISILHVGGVFDRMEYIATGSPLLQAFAAEHQASQRDVVISPQAWHMIAPYFAATVQSSGYAVLDSCVEPLRKVSVARHGAGAGGVSWRDLVSGVKEGELMRTLGRYVPGAVLPYINHQEEKWASELRRITVLFVNLGLLSGDTPATADTTAELLFVQSILHATQLAVYKYEGSLNKFLRDDKGSTLIAVFGLPPLAHEDDAVRGILAALAICARLIDLGLKPSVGVTTGMAFCGIVGTRGRREYSVLGDKVNLAARLMQHASMGYGGVLCDHETRYAAKDRLSFEEGGRITVKGKAKPVSVYQPYPRTIASLFSLQGKRMKTNRAGSVVAEGGGGSVALNTQQAAKVVTGSGSNGLIGQMPVLTRTTSTVMYRTGGDGGGSSAESSAKADSGLTARGSNHHAFFEGRSGVGMSSIRSIFDIFKQDHPKRKATSSHNSSSRQHTPPAAELSERDKQRADTFKREQRRRLMAALDDPVKPNMPAPLMHDVHLFRDNHTYAASFLEQCQLRRRERERARGGAALSAPVPIPGQGARESRLIGVNEAGEGEGEEHSVSEVGERKSVNGLSSASPSSSSPSPHPTHPPPHPRTTPSHASLRTQPYSLQIHPSHTPPLFSSTDSTPDTGSTPTTAEGLPSNTLADTKAREQAAAARRHSTPDLSTQPRPMRRPASSSNLQQLERVSERRAMKTASKLSTPQHSHAAAAAAKGANGIANAASGAHGGLSIPSVLRSHSFPDQDELQLLSAQPMAMGDSRRNSVSHSASNTEDRQLTSPLMLSASTSAHQPPPPIASGLPLPHRSITIILPDHVSSLTLSIAHLPTIRQVKEEVLLSLYRRGVLSIPADMSVKAMMDEWMLCVERDGEEMRVADDMRVDSLTQQDRRLSSSVSSTSNASISTTSALTLYLHHCPPSVTPPDQLAHYTDFLTQRIQQLLSSHHSSTIIIEGDVGLGKSKLLSTALASPPARAAHTIQALANPFDSQRPLSVFRDVFVTLCDEEVMRVGVGEYYELSQAENRRKVIVQKLRRRRREDDGRSSLESVVGCLNEVVTGLDMEESEETEAMSREERVQWSMLLLINVIHMIACSHPLVVVIDEAVFLDHYSWQLVLSLSRLDAGLLLLLATRPINKSNMAAFQTQTPLEYTTLLQEAQTSVITLQPRSDEVMYEMLREALGDKVEQVPTGLAQFVLRKAHGNPLVVKELVYALTHERLVEVDAGGRITLSPSLPLTSSNPHLLSSLVLPIPIPLTLSSILGSRLDRLGYVQRMLLKCAAVIGEEIGERLLVRLWELRELEKSGVGHAQHGVTPAASGGPSGGEVDGGHREEVVRELSGLLEMNMLRKGYGYEERERWEQQGTAPRGPEREDGTGERERVKYTFTHGFMREMVLSRMLDAQKRELETKLSEARCEMLRRKTEFLYAPQSASAPSTAGSMAMAIPPTVPSYSAAMAHLHSQPSLPSSHSYTYHPSTPHGTRDSFSSGYSNWQTTSQPSTPSSVSFALTPALFQANSAYRPLLTGTFTLIDPRSGGHPSTASQPRFFALYPELLACWDSEAAYTDSNAHNPRLCLHLDDSLLADDEQRVNAVVLLSLCWVERGGEAVCGVREVGLVWREDETYERWAMAIYRQLATESPMPQRLYTKQVEREEADEDESADSTVHPTPSPPPMLTSSSSFSSLLSLLHTPSSKPSHSTSITASLHSAATPSSAATPHSTLSLSAAEREVHERKLNTAHNAATASLHYILPPALMLVRKHKRGLFSSTWKKRYVFLTDDVLGIQETLQGRPSQLLLLSVGRPAGKSGGYDAQKRLHLLSVEVDCWSKGAAVSWSRRSVLFAAGSADEVKVWVDAIAQLLQKRRRSSVSLPWQNSSSRPTHSSSINSSASSILSAPSIPPHQRSASITQWSSGPPVNRPLFMALANDRRAMGGGGGSGPSSPVVGPFAASPSSSFISPILLQHASYSASPPSHSGRGSISGPGFTSPGPSPPLLLNERRRNSLNRLAPLAGVGTETVMEGREEPESGKPKSDEREEEGKLHHSTSSRVLKVDVDDGEERIVTVLLERKEASDSGRVEEGEEANAEDEHDEAEVEQLEGDSGEVRNSLNGYHDTESMQLYLSNVQSAFADANAQLVALSSPSPAKAEVDTPADRQQRESLSLSVQSLLVRLQQQMTDTVKLISRECAVAIDQQRAPVEDDENDPVCRTWRVTLPVVLPASLSSSLFPPPISSLSTLGDFSDFNYDIFALPASSLLPLVYSLFSHFSFFSLLSIPLTVFSRFVSSIQQQYRANPFHSFYHAVDVAQTTFVLLTSFHAQRSLTPVECFSLLLAALCHDVDHPALNNAYQVNAQTPLALVYNDASVLENHHCSVTFHTLAQHTCNVLASLHHADYVRARKLITHGILSTDMAVHFTVVDRLREFVEVREREGRGGELDVSHISEAQRVVLFAVYLHAADISNPCKRWPLHKRWTDAIQQEMLQQGEREASEGLDRSPYTDAAETYGRVGEVTSGFVRTYVLPLFALLQRLMPEAELCLLGIDDNMRRWADEDERVRRGMAAGASGLAAGGAADDSSGRGGGSAAPAGAERARDDGISSTSGENGALLRWMGGGGLIQAAYGGGAGGPIYRRRNSAV